MASTHSREPVTELAGADNPTRRDDQPSKLCRIQSVEELRRYLQVALQLEHSTIPPYLTALYSLHPDTNIDAARIITSVVVEEMLHLTLVANVLNAVGGSPDLTTRDFVPHYPAHLPDGESDFEVGVGPFSPSALTTFLRIERPGEPEHARFVSRLRSPRALLPSYHDSAGATMHFYSIGEFYREIDRGLGVLAATLSARGDDLFSGDPTRQITSDFRYSGGGEVIAVTDLDSARAAIRLICEQGEGLGGAIYDEEDELSHYYRFQQIRLGRFYQRGDVAGHPSGAAFDVDWKAVYPVTPNARVEEYPEDSRARRLAADFCVAYGAFLAQLTVALSGRADLLDAAVGEMFKLKDLALEIVRTPISLTHYATAAPVYRAMT